MAWLRTINADLEMLHGLVDPFEEIPDGSIDVSVTSPPYKRRGKKEDRYTRDLMLALGTLYGRKLAPGGIAFVNFGQLSDDFERPYEARRAVLEGQEDDTHPALQTGQTIIWAKSLAVPNWRVPILEEIKNRPWEGGVHDLLGRIRDILKGPGRLLTRGHYTPIHVTDRLLNYGWEFVFVFYKAPQSSLDRFSAGVEFADKGNMRRGTRGKNGDVHCAGDIWFIPHKTTGSTKKKKHRYQFPPALARRCLVTSGKGAGATVLEPFLGGGTVAAEARKLGMNVWGIDIDPGAVEESTARWEGTSPCRSQERALADG